jgi:N-acetylglucosaminyldiphosphoundecaprenol N-acetyl-beta-D-mannosaminyltransferase
MKSVSLELNNVTIETTVFKMNRYDALELFDYSIFNSKLEQIDTNSKCIINTLNQYSFVIAEKDILFKKALAESDVLLPDGVGIVAAFKLLKDIKIKKIAGSDIHVHLLNQLNKRSGTCFYLGSDEETLKNIKKRLAVEFPNITMSYYSPPFKLKFDELDNSIMVNYVNSFNPDVLFVGMTAPKQEKWVYEHKNLLETKVICSIGAVFDFYAGTVNRPKQIWINLGLEWFARLLKDPVHTWKRYIYYGPVFIGKILKLKIESLFTGKQTA